jgi:hypothetical protein
MAWDLSQLYNPGSGSIAVMVGPLGPTEPASIYSNGVSKAGGFFTFTGTNTAGPGASHEYVVLMTTNLLNSPSKNWTPIATNNFNADGSFSFSTGAIGTGTNAAYFTAKVVQ